MNKEQNILVSVCCITYNHEHFIEKTIQGFLEQHTNFDYEILIHDDASTDNTSNIIKKYEKQYPTKIKVIYQKENIFSKDRNPLFEVLIPLVKGKYIALCEGDDYWIEPYKLQKQVDYLESNLDCSLCFTNGYNFIQKNGKFSEYISPSTVLIKERYETEDLLFENFIPTASIVFRKKLLKGISKFIKSAPIGDMIINIYLSQFGYLGFINEFTIIRNIHSGGLTFIRNKEKLYKEFEITYDKLNEMLSFKYELLFDIFKKFREEIYKGYLDNTIIEFFNCRWGNILQNSSLSITIMLKYLLSNAKHKNNKIEIENKNLDLKNKAYDSIFLLSKYNNIAIFGLGKAGKMTYEFLKEYFSDKIKLFIDDVKKDNYMGIPIVTTKEFLEKHQKDIIVVFGKYQHLNSELIPNLKIPYLCLENIV